MFSLVLTGAEDEAAMEVDDAPEKSRRSAAMKTESRTVSLNAQSTTIVPVVRADCGPICNDFYQLHVISQFVVVVS